MLGLIDEYNSSDAQIGKIMNQKANYLAYATPTMTERLDSRISETETRLKELQELKDLLQKVPNLERILTLLQKGVY